MKSSILNKTGNYLLLFIIVLINTLTYGSYIFSEEPNYSMFVFYLSSVLSVFSFNLFTKINLGIMASPIVEISTYTQKIFESFKKEKEETALINSMVCVFIGTVVFGILSLLAGKIHLSRFSKLAPLSVLFGIVGAIGLAQFNILLSEKEAALRLAIFLIALIKFVIQKFFPKKDYLTILFGALFILIFNFASPKLFGDVKRFYGRDCNLYRVFFDITKFSYKRINLGGIARNMPEVIKMSLFCMVHLPINLLSFSIHMNVNTNLDKEMVAQGFSNLVCSVFVLPSYFTYSLSALMNKSPSTKMDGFIIGASLIPIVFIIGKARCYVPTFYLASFPSLIGITLCYTAMIESLSYSNLPEYLIILAVMSLGWRIDLIFAFFVGILLCAILNLHYYVTSLYFRKNKHRDLYKGCLEPLLVKEGISYLNINYVLFFGTISVLKQDFSCLQSGIVVIDLQKCYSFDMLANKVFSDLIGNSPKFFVVIGNPMFFRAPQENNVVVTSDYNEAADIIQRRLCDIQ